MNLEKPHLVAANTSYTPDAGFNATLYEYFDWRQLKQEMAKLNRSSKVVEFKATLQVMSTSLGCKASGVNQKLTDQTFLWPQLIKLADNPVESLFIDGDQQAVAAPQITKPELVRGVLAFKYCFKQDCAGETFEYTKCGYYNLYFAIPVLSIFGIFFLWLVTQEARSWYIGPMTEIPLSAKEWYEFFDKSKFGAGDIIKHSSQDQSITSTQSMRGRATTATYKVAMGENLNIVRD